MVLVCFTHVKYIYSIILICNIKLQKKQVYINTIRKTFFSMRKYGNIEIKEFKLEKLKSKIFTRCITDTPDRYPEYNKCPQQKTVALHTASH